MSEKKSAKDRDSLTIGKPKYEAPKLQRLSTDRTEGGPFATGSEATNGPS